VISDTDIVNGYMWILGRIPSAAEVAANRAHYGGVQDGAVEDFQRALMTSREFQARRIGLHRATRAPTELDRSRLVFLHIEKCGGTTLHDMLSTQFAPELICPERHDGLGDWTVNELAVFDLFSGHFDLACCRSIPGTVRFMTMLREPKARLLSLYRFWRAHRPDPHRDRYNLLRMARSMSPEAFFADPLVSGHVSIRNAIAGQLTRTSNRMLLAPEDPILCDPSMAVDRAWAALEQFEAVGIMERFDDSHVLLNARLELSMPAIAPRQVLTNLVRTDPELTEVAIEPLSPALDALLDPLTDIDRQLYARATARFDQALARLGHAPARPPLAARAARLLGIRHRA
jgi:hypothetical protein